MIVSNGVRALVREFADLDILMDPRFAPAYLSLPTERKAVALIGYHNVSIEDLLQYFREEPNPVE